MASIIPNTKNGKIVSYKFKACVGRDELGKQVFKCTTWKIPDGLAVSRVERAAQRAAVSWERQAKEAYSLFAGGIDMRIKFGTICLCCLYHFMC